MYINSSHIKLYQRHCCWTSNNITLQQISQTLNNSSIQNTINYIPFMFHNNISCFIYELYNIVAFNLKEGDDVDLQKNY